MPETSNSDAEQLRVPLDQLYLDPNSYRLIGEEDYIPVPDDKVFDDEVQSRTMELVLGERESNVQDLIASFFENGWLPVDQIQVREQGSGRYLVIDGNRRVATLKYIKDRDNALRDEFDVDGAVELDEVYFHEITGVPLDSEFFESVPVKIYHNADEACHLVFMGLKHVSGNKRWPAFSQACMLRDLNVRHGWSAEHIAAALGMNKRDFSLSQGVLALCEFYRKSEHGGQFRSEQYSLFREIVKSPDLREWLGWDDERHSAGNKRNLERLFSWVSVVPIEEEHEEEGEGSAVRAEPIITTGSQVRELAKLIGDEVALRILERTRSLSKAMLASGKALKERTRDVLEQMEAGAITLQSMNGHVDSKALDRIASIVHTLQSLQAAKGQAPRVVAGVDGSEPFSKERQGHFSELTVEHYRGLSGLRLLELRRINVVAGLNNSGKTSVLEAAYLLSQQHEVDALFEVMRRRARLEDLPPRWAYEQAPADTRIKGCFDGMDAHLHITCERDESQIEDSSFYIGSVTMEAVYSSQRQRSRTHLFSEGRNRATSRQGKHVLCKAVLSSPFSQHDPTMLAKLYERSVETKTKEQVLDFLRRAVDEGLENIELANEFKRFLVTHRSHERALDLSSFGEGMQRIFHVGLLFSWARDGLVLIDEFENAIHASLLVDFTGFLQELAREFNTQVFLSTHSKECIDAFVYNGKYLEDVGYYSIKREPEGTRCERVTAETLQRLLEAADVDIRRLR